MVPFSRLESLKPPRDAFTVYDYCPVRYPFSCRGPQLPVVVLYLFTCDSLVLVSSSYARPPWAAVGAAALSLQKLLAWQG